MKKLLLLAAMAAVALGASAGYTIEKVWTLNAPSIFTVTNDVRQGFGMNGKFYIHNKADQLVYEVDQNGLTGVTFEGGTNCGVSRDEAGNIIVSNAGFGSTAWVQATFKVINPATGEVKVYTVPEESGLTGRCDFFGFCKGNMLENGELFLTAGTPDNSIYTDGIARVPIADGEVDVDNCYLATCAGLNTNTSTVIHYYNDLNGNPALLFAYRSGAPGKLVPDGENFVRTGLVLPNKGACNGVFPIIYDGKELYLYPTLPNYQDGFAIAEAGAEAPIIEVPSSVSANPNGIQCDWLNAEVDANGVTIYQYVPGGQISVYRLTKEVEIPNVYMLGGDDQPWDPTQGTQFTYADGVYTATITFPAELNYFGFTTELAENNDEGGWNYIEPFRFGAIADEGSDYWYTGEEDYISLTWDAYHAIRIPGGEYKLTVDLNEMKLYIEKIEAPQGLRGDVNMSNDVTIADVTALIDYLLTNNAEGISLENANCNLDEGVTIADVTALIDYLLSGNWAN